MWGVSKLQCLLFLFPTIHAITTIADKIPVSIPDGQIPTHPHDNENLTACDQDLDCGEDGYCFESYCESYEPDHPQHPPPTSNSINDGNKTAEGSPVSVPDSFIPFQISKENLTTCAEDLDCGVEKYCLQSYCESCVPCETLLCRQSPLIPNSTILVCAKTFEECGPCLPGYEHESLTNGRHSNKCFPKTPSQSTYDDYHWISDWIEEHVIILICMFYLLWKKLKKLGSRICKSLGDFGRTCIQQVRNSPCLSACCMCVSSVFSVFIRKNSGPQIENSTSNEDIESGNTPHQNTSNGLQLNSDQSNIQVNLSRRISV